ncbi:MAG: type II toxin-antitoxin system PemK/MazF family toxin [Actinomycetota bacterium]|nr:type II toxin-antitoxin system PemK/MazF family toxin [Actinomycetota bacterium]
MILRGEVYDVDLGQPVGHEPARRRPAVVVSSDVVSNSVGGLVAVVPISSRSYGLRSHVELDSAQSGLAHVSFARCDQLRFVAVERLNGRRGATSTGEVASIDTALRFVLDL